MYNKRRKQILLNLLCVLLIASMNGCTTYRVRIDSIRGQSVKHQNGTKYILLSGMQNISASDLQFQEFASYIHGALQRRGFVHVTDHQEADMVILMNYGIGNPIITPYSYSLPVYGQTGGGTATYSSTTYGATYGIAPVRTTGTMYVPPTTGVVGYSTYSGTKTSYPRHILLDAIDLPTYLKTEEVITIWRTTVTSSGESGDLRRVFPILVAASERHIGTNTGRAITVELLEADSRVRTVKSSIQEP